MLVRKTRKSRAKRGSRTHGWGGQKRHRGAGNRGGKGMAGVGKRGGQKLTKYLAHGGKRPIGSHGMQITRYKPSLKTINLYQIEASLDLWMDSKLITKEKYVYVIELRKVGYGKVLSQGKLTHKLKITADAFSKAAEAKITAAGGELIKL